MRRRLAGAIFALLVLALPRWSGATLEESLPTDHWSYALLDQLRLRGYLTTLFVSNRPFTRGQVARSLQTIQREIDAGQRSSFPADTRLLDQLTGEFKEELDELRHLPIEVKILVRIVRAFEDPARRKVAVADDDFDRERSVAFGVEWGNHGVLGISRIVGASP